jgi:hypothetical protein
MYNGLVRIYWDIFEKIDTIKIDSLPVFNTRKILNNQVKRMRDGSGVSYWMPAVFVEIRTYNEGVIGNELTYADMDVIFHIVHNELDSADGNLDQNINVFELRNKIKSNFSMFKPTNCGLFIWNGEVGDFNHDNIYEWKLTYKCHYIDNVANPMITGNQYEYNGATVSLSIVYDDGFGDPIIEPIQITI